MVRVARVTADVPDTVSVSRAEPDVRHAGIIEPGTWTHNSSAEHQRWIRPATERLPGTSATPLHGPLLPRITVGWKVLHI